MRFMNFQWGNWSQPINAFIHSLPAFVILLTLVTLEAAPPSCPAVTPTSLTFQPPDSTPTLLLTCPQFPHQFLLYINWPISTYSLPDCVLCFQCCSSPCFSASLLTTAPYPDFTCCFCSPSPSRGELLWIFFHLKILSRDTKYLQTYLSNQNTSCTSTGVLETVTHSPLPLIIAHKTRHIMHSMCTHTLTHFETVPGADAECEINTIWSYLLSLISTDTTL